MCQLIVQKWALRLRIATRVAAALVIVSRTAASVVSLAKQRATSATLGHVCMTAIVAHNHNVVVIVHKFALSQMA